MPITTTSTPPAGSPLPDLDPTPITVITPTLNAADYLQSCLDSVRQQHVPGMQHLIVDGGSTDATYDLAHQSPAVTWLACPSSSQTQAINVGLRQANGELVAWLNADDVYAPNALPFVVEQFRAQPALDVLYGDCEVIGPDGGRLWWERPGAYDFNRLLRRGNYIAQPAVFLRRDVFQAIGYLDESLELAMDYDLWLRLRGRQVGYVPRTLASFRWHPDSKSARSQIQGWREFRRILAKHGSGWTPELVWSYARLLVTLGRMRVERRLTGSKPMRPLTR